MTALFDVPADRDEGPVPAIIAGSGAYDDSNEIIKIPVTHGHEAIINVPDLEIVGRYRWRLLKGHNGKLYAYTSGPLYMHRLITGALCGQETDHINGNGLDNRRCNLRPATPGQNKANTWKPRRPDGSPHSSPFKGVSWDRSRGKWQSKIRVNGRHKNLGRFESVVEAAIAYDIAAEAAWGEFAQLNFPEPARMSAPTPSAYSRSRKEASL